MPWKTKYGDHYHMTQGCCGAFIECSTKGLKPCATCCGTKVSPKVKVVPGGHAGGGGMLAGGTTIPEQAGLMSRDAQGREARPGIITLTIDRGRTEPEPEPETPRQPERPEGWLSSVVASDAYSFLREDERLGERIDSLFLGGSNAYGLGLPGSDIDVRGFAMRDGFSILTGRDFETFTEIRTDTTIYSFDKFLTLLGQCNPNIIEFLGLREDAYERMGPAGKALYSNREAFLSKRAAKTFGGYALSQLNRLENALGRSPKTEEIQRRKLRRSLEHAIASFEERYGSYRSGSARIRVVPAGEGDDGQVLLDIGMRGVDIHELNEMLSQTTNVARDYDKLTARNRKKDAYHLAKHMSHLLRLYKMGAEILSGEGVITDRRDAGDADFLMDVKLGKYLNKDGTEIDDEFFDIVDELGRKMDEAERKSRLPNEQDTDTIARIRERENLRVIGHEYFLMP